MRDSNAATATGSAMHKEHPCTAPQSHPEASSRGSRVFPVAERTPAVHAAARRMLAALADSYRITAAPPPDR